MLLTPNHGGGSTQSSSIRATGLELQLLQIMQDLNHSSREEYLQQRITSLQASYNVAYRMKLAGETLTPDQLALEVEQEIELINSTGILQPMVAKWLAVLDHKFLTQYPIEN